MATDPKNDDEDDHFSTAADEPTAMWTEEMLRDATASADDQPGAPTEKPSGAMSSQTSHPPLRSGARRRPPLAAPQRESMSWSMTIALAVVLGTAVYFLVRFLKG